MSMSTLGQQLAAINAPGGNTGSTLSSSRRHEDTIGRGLAHSVQVGHGLYNKSHKYKPSIIHEDARKASDVPLSTIRENCVESLRHLETVDSEFGVFVGILCQVDTKERGLLVHAENQKIDKRIEDLLFRLSLIMRCSENNSDTNNNLTSCLNVIEFLLRKYDIHIRPNTASTMLLVMLPHHEEPYFLRMLQLIDLANLSEWAFLRPYAFSGARLARSILAQQASKDVALIRSLGRLSQRNSKLTYSQQSLSFTAAVLVEALTLQTQRKGSMEERTCQALLPFVVAACRNQQYYKKMLNGTFSQDDNSGEVWQNWGYVMASTMVENSVLAPEPRSLLVTSVLQGLTQQQEVGNTTLKTLSPYSMSSGMIVALTILAQDSPNNTDDKIDSIDSSYLPMLSPSSGTSSSATSPVKNCGYSMMDKDILHALLKLDDTDKKNYNTNINDKVSIISKSTVASLLAHLYSTEGLVDFEHWIASILVVGWKRFVKYHKRSDSKNRKGRIDCLKILNLILNLVQHPHLEKLWKQSNGQWVESFVSFIFLHTTISVFDAGMNYKDGRKDTEENQIYDEEYIKPLLQTLLKLDRVAYDRGITHALIRTKNKQSRKDLATYLGLTKLQHGSDQVTADSIGEDLNEGDGMSIVLPPRVALEHVDNRVRFEAISGLLEEAKGAEDRIDATDGEETIQRALFRRFVMDDDRQVALAAAKGLDELLTMKGELVLNSMDNTEFGEGALEALYKWAQSSNDEEQIKDQLLIYACRLASSAAKLLRLSSQVGMTFVRLIEGLGAFICHPNDVISEEAARGVIVAWDGNISSKKNIDVENLAKSLLISDDIMLQKFRRVFREHNSSELHIRRQLSRVILDAISTCNSSAKVRSETLEYCLWLSEVFSNSFSEDDIDKLGKCLKMTVSFLAANPENLHSTFCRLASSEGPVFRVAVGPFIRSVCDNVKDKQGDYVEPMSVLMEVVLAANSYNQIKNLLLVAREIASNDTIGNFYAVAPSLALTCHHGEEVRGLAADFLSMLGDILSKSPLKDEWRILSVVCQYFAKNRSSVVLRGKSSLSESLATILSHSKETASIQKHLLTAVLCSVTAYGATDTVSSTEYCTKSWLCCDSLIGGYKTGVILLEAFEIAGENAFPILSRWRCVGTPILSLFLSPSLGGIKEISCYQSQLIHTVVRILKGVTMPAPLRQDVSSTSTIITTGPSSHGRRSRSYSFGKNNGVGVLKPYPTDMQASIVSILTEKTDGVVHKEVVTCLYEIVLCSNSWVTEVFANLNGVTRRKIAAAILNAASESLFHGVDAVLLSLPLDANDITKLLADQNSDEVGLSKTTFISDFISTNHSKLMSNSGINELFASIFKKLSCFAKANEKNDESIEFARQALLSAVLELVNSSLNIGSMNIQFWTKKKRLDSWLDILVNIIVHNKGSATHFVSLRSKRTVFFIFAALCEKYPKVVVPNVTSIITGVVSELHSSGGENTLASCFDLLIPIYIKHSAAANLSPVDLFRSFINHACMLGECLKPKVYEAFVHALAIIPEKKDQMNSPVGTFLSVALAGEMYSASGNGPEKLDVSHLPALAIQALSQTTTDLRIGAVWTMQNYAKEILLNLLEESMSTTDSNFSVGYLTEIVFEGSSCTNRISPEQVISRISSSPETFEKLCSCLIIVTCDVVTTHESRNIIRQSDGLGSTIILRLWQDLLLIQSACQHHLGGSNNHDKANFLERIVEITSHALDGIQNSLPSHIFLAFVTSLITEGETEELRARAVQLIVDRSESIHPGQSEAILFVEMIPPLLQLLRPEKSGCEKEERTGEFLLQSVFAAIDCIGRNACLSLDASVNERHFEIFTESLLKASSVLETESLSTNNGLFLDIPSESRQLVSSAALCSSTGIKICGPRALPLLPKLMKPLLKFQFVASAFLKSSTSKNNVDKKELIQAKMMQLAILRTLSSIIDKMPMLLKPYLVDIIKGFSGVFGSLHNYTSNHSQSIQPELEALQNLMTSRIPARQLIPAASKSIISTPTLDLNLPTLSILSESITKSKSSDVSGMISIVLETATYVFEKDVVQEGDPAMMEATDELILSLVMKLSEMQLRLLYRKFREWRGDLDEYCPEKSGPRRRAFWRLSSALSKQLKSIYLSCLTTVFSDAVDELEMMASFLSTKDSVKKAEGKKKQRLLNGERRVGLDAASLESLKYLLLCLEVSLRSDAYEGGSWIRELESQRYEKLLHPLGKLLQCRLPCNISDNSFETIVQGGIPGSGSVVECLVALATAAGDEQLWKPLNHSLLQACSDENRSEVRKAGVSCLLSLINSIGEEYMVLIPECLPILSELLEDSDEIVTGIAQECISQSEELLGESLQDSLR